MAVGYSFSRAGQKNVPRGAKVRIIIIIFNAEVWSSCPICPPPPPYWMAMAGMLACYSMFDNFDNFQSVQDELHNNNGEYTCYIRREEQDGRRN